MLHLYGFANSGPTKSALSLQAGIGSVLAGSLFVILQSLGAATLFATFVNGIVRGAGAIVALLVLQSAVMTVRLWVMLAGWLTGWMERCSSVYPSWWGGTGNRQAWVEEERVGRRDSLAPVSDLSAKPASQ